MVPVSEMTWVSKMARARGPMWVAATGTDWVWLLASQREEAKAHETDPRSGEWMDEWKGRLKDRRKAHT